MVTEKDKCTIGSVLLVFKEMAGTFSAVRFEQALDLVLQYPCKCYRLRSLSWAMHSPTRVAAENTVIAS